jgi:iron transport multicopper oxidase
MSNYRHMMSGLSATFIEAPIDLQSHLKIPQDQYDVCKAGGVKTSGNAAGNTQNVFDLDGENSPPDVIPDGFTARGIVALVFSCVAAFVGLAIIVWYGHANV